MTETIKKTRLHPWHIAHGARMAEFGGYEMPLWYASARDEHVSVISRAGAFDTSHMAVAMVSGVDALDLLQRCFTNDLSACVGKGKRPLSPGRCVYGAFLNEKGWVIDDAIIYRLDEADFMVVVNAGMGGPIADHLQANLAGGTARIIDLTDRVGKMDVQGPMAARIMEKVLSEPDRVFEKMPYFSFKGHFDADGPGSEAARLADGTPILLSRTGYTGEFGFEIFTAPEAFVKTWETISAAGEKFRMTPCGLASRDSLRAGATLPLSHQDIGNWPFIHHPWPFALPFAPDGASFTKRFIGDDALGNIQNPEYTVPFAGDDPRKVNMPAAVFDSDGRKMGKVLTCATDMAIGRSQGRIYSMADPNPPEGLKIRGLSCGFAKVDRPLSPGDRITLDDGRRKIAVRVEKDIRPHRTARVPLESMR